MKCSEKQYENWKTELRNRRNDIRSRNYNKKRMPLYEESNYIHERILEQLISLYEKDELDWGQAFDIHHDMMYEWTKVQRIVAVLASDGRTEKITQLTENEVITAKEIAKERIDRLFEG